MNTKDLFCGLEQAETITFTPTRQAGLARLEQFALQAGLQYAKR